MEAEELSLERKRVLQLVAGWTCTHPALLLDVRGCSTRDETPARQREALAMARCERAVEFLMSQAVGLLVEQCHPSNCYGDCFQGIEIRPMMRVEVDGTFADEGSVQLRDTQAVRKVVSDTAFWGDSSRVLVEVFYDGGPKLGQRRVVALQHELADLGLSRDKLHGRARPGLKGKAVFLLYGEFEAEHSSPDRPQSRGATRTPTDRPQSRGATGPTDRPQSRGATGTPTRGRPDRSGFGGVRGVGMRTKTL